MATYKWDPTTGMYILSDDQSFAVITNQPDYSPGQTVQITANFDPNSTVQFTVAHDIGAGADGIWGTADDVLSYDLTGTGPAWSWTATADVNGVIDTSWFVNQDALGQRFELIAVEQAADGAYTGPATMMSFTDSFTPVDATSSDPSWIGTPTFSFDNGVTFLTEDPTLVTGTGRFPAFVQIQASPQEAGVEEGFNTNFRPSVEDTQNPLVHNHAIVLGDIPTVTIDGVVYRQFLLDLNEPNDVGAPQINLDALKIYSSSVGNLSTLSGANPLFDMDGGADGKIGNADDVNVSVQLTDWTSGSGHGDYKVLIPDSYFTGVTDSTFIYLDSQFSGADAGFEEWALGLAPTTPPPTPQAALSLTKDTVCPDDPTHSVATGTLLAGSGVEWTYAVKNTGDTNLTNIVVTDSGADDLFNTTDDVTVSAVLVGGFNAGDTNHDGLLNPGETWQYSATGTAIDGVYVNLAHVTSQAIFDLANPPATPNPAGDDTSTYTGIDPHMTLVKLTNGADNAGNILAGSSVTWTYTLTNDGDVALTVNHNTGLTDDNGTPGTGTAALNDFHPTYVSGDVGNDGIMGVGEVWTFTASGTAQLGSYTNTATALATTITDSCDNSVTPSASDSSGYTGTFVEQGGTLTQGFWGSHLDAWDGVFGHESNPTKSAFNSGVLSKLDINPSPGPNGNLLLGDTNHDGIANDLHDLWITDKLAGTIESSSTSGDARIIMLQQAIATQLNIDNGKAEPNNLIDEAVMWLTKQGAWSGVGVNVGGAAPADNGFGGTVSTVAENGSHTALLGSSVATSSTAWHSFVNVSSDGGVTYLVGSTPTNVSADGEGLKNALMWWNDGHLVTTAAGQVAYDPDGLGAGGVNPATINLNTLDEFWLTLHQQTGLTGIA
jgi:hypothetical protein